MWNDRNIEGFEVVVANNLLVAVNSVQEVEYEQPPQSSLYLRRTTRFDLSVWFHGSMNLWRGLRLANARPVARVTSKPSVLFVRWLSNPKPALLPSTTQDSPLLALRRTLEKNLRKGNYQEAAEAFRKHMASTRLRNQSRFETFERVADLFLKYGETNSAKIVHTRMKNEGFIPSLRLRACMTVLLKGSGKSALKAAPKAMALEGFEESTLRYLLAVVFVNIPCSSELIEGFVGAFTQTRPADYVLSKSTCSLLAHLHTRLGSPELANKWCPKPVGRLSQDRRRLLAMAESDPGLKSIIQAAILRLDMDGKEHDRTLYNSLMQYLLQKRQYTRAFQIYRLMLNGERAISPNAPTFMLLFDAWLTISEPRSFRSRKQKPPLDAPTPREIFRAMMYKHRSSSPCGAHSSITVNTLTAALRAFMRQDDYAGAFVVLRTFRLCNHQAPVNAYHAVIEGLICRIRKEMQFQTPSDVRKQVLWCHRFVQRGDISILPSDSHILVEGILNLGLSAILDFDPLPLPDAPQLHSFLRHSSSGASRKSTSARKNAFLELTRTPHRVPGPLVVIGILKAWDDQWDITPLERILRRAILATHVKLFVPPAKAVSREIAEAKVEMVIQKGNPTDVVPKVA
ncbi:hypothetical protein BC835DRAFT_1415909 [Cytidiella melzeri]|nr:hypothetical protein BC835DRAFT_1415909 [Cytidiella melzeri]